MQRLLSLTVNGDAWDGSAMSDRRRSYSEMRITALAAIAVALLANAATARAVPVTYEIGVVVTSYTFFDRTVDPVPPTLQIGDKAAFRVTFDQDDCWGDCSNGYFSARLTGINLDGRWTSASQDGFGFDESHPGEEYCGSNSTYGCSALRFGAAYTFFSNWAIDRWFDPASPSGLRNDSSGSYFFCNIANCDLGGTGKMTYVRSVPEPGSLALLGLGLAGLGIARRRNAVC